MKRVSLNDKIAVVILLSEKSICEEVKLLPTVHFKVDEHSVFLMNAKNPVA